MLPCVTRPPVVHVPDDFFLGILNTAWSAQCEIHPIGSNQPPWAAGESII